MEQMKPFSDSRLEGYCAYCGNITNTRDHVPSKILLDEPYPENLPVVPACSKCNQGFSLDEEYVACLIGCINIGSTNPGDMKRDKIKRILSRKPALSAHINTARQKTDGGIFFDVEYGRIQNVVMKLGRGHAAFENSDPLLEEPSSVLIKPLPQMTVSEITSFETISQGLPLWPEVGSRGFQRAIKRFVSPILEPDWLVVQPKRYRYSVHVTNLGLTIRMVLSEYLACAVIW